MDVKVLIQSLFDPKGTDQARNALGQFQSTGASTASGIGSVFKGVTGVFAGIGLAIDGVSKVASLAGGAIAGALGPSVEMEGLVTQFSVLLGSADAAKERMADLVAFADVTPFNLPEVARASTVLQTLTKGALATSDGLRMVGDVAAGTNQPFAELSVWVGRAYDGLQSGRPVGDATNRLQELGVITGDVRGKIEQLQAEGKKGPEVWNVLAKEFGKFSGMMEAKSKTLSGLLSTLQDSFDGLLRAVFGDAAEGAKGPLVFLIDTLNALKEPLAQIIRDAQVFWSALYGDEAQGFTSFISENAVPALVTLAGVLSDVGKIAAGLWEGALGTGRLAMTGLMQLFQGIYGIIMGIPVAISYAFTKVLQFTRATLEALPEALRPEGATRWLAQKQASQESATAQMWAPGAALGRLSDTFTEQAAESFGKAGFAFGQVGVTQGEGAASGAKPKAAAAKTTDDTVDSGLSKAEQKRAKEAAKLADEQAKQVRDIHIASIEDEYTQSRSLLYAKYQEDLAAAGTNNDLQTALRAKYLQDRQAVDDAQAKKTEEFDRQIAATRDQWERDRDAEKRQREAETERMREAAEQNALNRYQMRVGQVEAALNPALSSVSNGITRVILQVGTLREAFLAVRDAIVGQMVSAVVSFFGRLAAEQIANALFGKALAAAQTAALLPIAAAQSAIWATPATLSTIATAGASAAAAPGLIAGATAITKGLASFAVGSPQLPHDMVAMVHQDEIIAPAGISNDARRGNFGPLAQFLGVSGSGGGSGATGGASAPLGPQATGTLVNLDSEVLDVLARRGSAVTRLFAHQANAWAGA